MEDLNSILSTPAAAEGAGEGSSGGTTEERHDQQHDDSHTAADETGAADDRVAADQGADGGEVKAQLSALTKERERIRRKEAELEERERRLSDGSGEGTAADGGNQEQQPAGNDPRAELRDLRKQLREASFNAGLDPEDESLAAEVDKLEDQIDELRLQIFTEDQKSVKAKDREASEYGEVFTDVHDAYPFLDVKHPQASAELNEDINSYYFGRINAGDSRAEALRKAVDKFAPAYAARLEKDGGTSGQQGSHAAREKISRGGFSEVRSASRTQSTKSYAGPTPLGAILNGKS